MENTSRKGNVSTSRISYLGETNSPKKIAKEIAAHMIERDNVDFD
jgi:hypothetical protein